jgi:hypothetical protein
MAKIRKVIFMAALNGALLSSAAAQSRRFFPDDPIQSMPAPLPVTTVLKSSINHFYDFLAQRRDAGPVTAIQAGAVNTVGEVPDSEWFTNRHGMHRMSRQELQGGARNGEAPSGPFTITGGKNEGISAGFRMKDSMGQLYFVKFDAPDYPELATSADVIVSKILYAIGYNTPQNEIVNFRLSDLSLSPTATITLTGGRSRQMTWKDVEEIVRTISHHNDGSFRGVASRSVKGEIIGPFQYQGTRGDDPNDIVAHENRRDLRGLYVFGAWLNNTDLRAGNTLDSIVEENGVRFIRHHLIDFGSALGSDGDRPKDARLGHEFMLARPMEAVTNILSFGVAPKSWERTYYPKVRAAGHFESASFEPDNWKSNYPNPAFLSRLPDDEFWAAKQVMAFTDDDIRAIVETARISDPRSAEYMVRTLLQRRDKIGRVFFSKVLPLDHFRVMNSKLLFDDLAVKYGFHAERNYRVQWYLFDNFRQTQNFISASESAELPAEIDVASPGSYFSALINSEGNGAQTVKIYLRKEKDSYKVVGIERTW